MSLSPKTSSEIGKLIVTTIREKLGNYNPETKHMPFHHRLLGKDIYAMFSFIHSMNTTFGMSIFEPVAVILAKSAGNYAEKQHKLLGKIDDETEETIRKIHHQLRKGDIDASKICEIEQVRKTIKEGKPETDPDSTVDLFVQGTERTVHLFDLKTAKPNISNFKDFKRTLLEWIAIFLAKNPNAKVNSYIAIPYNPYEPKPYERWTLKGMLDLDNELKVADEFWNFLGGENTYEQLLSVFETVGIELRPEIDARFQRFNT